MHTDIQAIYDALRTHPDLSVDIFENEEGSLVFLDRSLSTGETLHIQFAAYAVTKSVELNAYAPLEIRADQISVLHNLLRLLTSGYLHFNNIYECRYFKFSWRDNWMIITYFYPDTAAPAESAYEMVIRACRAAEQAYPFIRSGLTL